MKSKTLAILAFGIVASMAIIPSAFAETLDMNGISVNTTQGLTVIVIGAFAGVTVAYLGYNKTKENWDTIKFIDSVIHAVLVSVPLAVACAMAQTNLGIFEYVTIFGSAMGYSWITKKVTQPTITSNQG